jgi:hypothetical protein
MFVLAEGSSRAALFYVGRDGDCGDGEADELPLAAAEAADRVSHHEHVFEVIEAQPGAAEVLCGTVLALDGNAADWVQVIENSLVIGRVWPKRTAACGIGVGWAAHEPVLVS